MAVDMFLELEGIKGESRDSVHADKIDILAYSWGMSQSGTTHSGTGGGAGKVSVQDLSITKFLDRSSPVLAGNCSTGKHIPSGKLIVRKAGETPLEYLVIELKEILISSVSTGASSGEDRLTENVTLNFAEYKIVYTPQKKDGSGDAAVEFAFNIAENVKV